MRSKFSNEKTLYFTPNSAKWHFSAVQNFESKLFPGPLTQFSENYIQHCSPMYKEKWTPQNRPDWFTQDIGKCYNIQFTWFYLWIYHYTIQTQHVGKIFCCETIYNVCYLNLYLGACCHCYICKIYPPWLTYVVRFEHNFFINERQRDPLITLYSSSVGRLATLDTKCVAVHIWSMEPTWACSQSPI